MQKRMHSREFKLDVVRQIATDQNLSAQICREYGLGESVLSRWGKEYQERGEAAFLSINLPASPSACALADLMWNIRPQFCNRLSFGGVSIADHVKDWHVERYNGSHEVCHQLTAGRRARGKRVSRLADMQSLLGASDWVKNQEALLREGVQWSWPHMPCRNTSSYAPALLDSQEESQKQGLHVYEAQSGMVS